MVLPTQLKVKVNCDGNYVTLVVAFNITYQSLIDRIDAKVGRFSNNAISRGTMRLSIAMKMVTLLPSSLTTTYTLPSKNGGKLKDNSTTLDYWAKSSYFASVSTARIFMKDGS